MAVNSFMVYMDVFISVQPRTAQSPDFFELLILISKPANLGVKLIKFRFMYLLFFTLFSCVVLGSPAFWKTKKKPAEPISVYRIGTRWASTLIYMRQST